MTDDSGSGSGRSDTGESIIERLGSSRRTFLKGTSAIAGGAALGSTAAGEESESNGESKSDGGTNDDENSGPTNVVMYVGDGQGVTHLSLGRYLKAYQEDPEAFPLNVSEVGYNFDRFEAEGLTTTHPDDPNEFVTDSAARGRPSVPASRRITARSVATPRTASSSRRRFSKRPARWAMRPAS